MKLFEELFAREPLPLFLAPMEAVTDEPFRKICKRFGADVMVSEFISSEALIRDVSESVGKMSFSDEERPLGIQIFGHNESSLREAAEIAAAQNPDFIDINWGCPVKKVVSKGAGSAILKDVDKMVRLTKSVVDAVKLPVTVKTRLGWEATDKPIVRVAEALQDIGIQAIAIHGRTRSQMYSGEADWTLIGEVKNNPRMHIPVIGNGDINSPEKAADYKKRYGVDAVMVGRAAIGNPWIFKQIRDFISTGSYSIPTYEERVLVCLEHLRAEASAKGDRRAVLEMRKHYAGYFKAIPYFKETKLKLMEALTLAEIETAFSGKSL
ncbi:MAG: tRNA dihydrouridine synthase DusB [Bacteroidales bacterium]|nr:tRNA dihydrouridine synthase DusB [Bacteroidales bacterium]